ncbi:glycosyltransferase family 39 protein [Gimesia sp.]|uniref:ArnT family glycosyltransferase n=1 Tax=Gimesia sp. TaxID=2024833 RepID=UPI0032EB3B63
MPQTSMHNPEDQTQPAASTTVKALVALLLTVHAGLLAWSATKHSPNLNEHAHLVAGISHWKFARFELYRVNPPLVRMVAALPVLFSDAKYEWSGFYESPGARPVFTLGPEFIHVNGARFIWYLTLARWACIPFSLLGGYLCYRWAKDLYGSWAGVFSLTLWCFSPNIIAHGQCITPDCGATVLGLAATYAFWKWLQSPHWMQMVIAGVVLGLAELTKSTWIILFGLWPLIWLVWFITRATSPNTPWHRQALQLGTILLLGVYLLNLGYGFEGSFTQLKAFQFVSETLTDVERDKEERVISERQNRFQDSWIGALPVPLPSNYLLGIDVQKKDFEDFGRESYLRGEFRDKGWWYYYLYALTIKVPLGYWILFGLTMVHACWLGSSVRTTWQNGFVLAVPALTVLILVSSQTGFNHHMRYVLPIFPFAFIWMGQSALWFIEKKKIAALVTSISLTWALGCSIWIYPHSLAYFNELVRGPYNGHQHLLHSNIDWGQDLLFLKQWIRDHPEAKPFYMCYYSYFDPRDLGMDYLLPPVNEEQSTNFQPPPGWYAISVNYMKGYGWRYPKNGFAYFQKYKPVDTAGYSIYIYRIPESDLR